LSGTRKRTAACAAASVGAVADQLATSSPASTVTLLDGDLQLVKSSLDAPVPWETTTQ
jgi:hypothetical protein